MRVTATKSAYEAQKHRALLEKIKPFVGVENLIGSIQRDLITLFEVHADESFLGIFISRVDRLIDGSRELVIMHASAAVDTPMPISSVFNPLWDQVAIENGLRSIRVHSDRRGLDRILEKNKYEFQEAVYRKAL